MEETDKKNRNRHEKTIITLVKQKDTSLAELREKTSRQAVLYHIPKLYEDNLIRAYIKGAGVKDDEIFYTFVNRYEYPQEIRKLIDCMCVNDIQVEPQFFNEFVELYIKRVPIPEFIRLDLIRECIRKEARMVAFALMSNMIPNLKENVIMSLTTRKDYHRKLIVELIPKRAWLKWRGRG